MVLSPKSSSVARHAAHPHPGALAQPGSFRAYAFAVGLLMVALISILGIGVAPPFDRGAPSTRAACGGRHVGPGTESPFHEQRSELYDKMEEDFNKKGAAFLFGGETSQSLKISDIFKRDQGEVKPVLKPARPPVRAIILRLNPSFAEMMRNLVKEHLIHHFPGGVWFQDDLLYHNSLFHASHHLSPVAASGKELEEEIKAVKGVSRRLCPPLVSLDRVLLTSTGVLLACWQVLEGTDPAEFRAMLRDALPKAPKKQTYNRVILHTTLARIVAPPIWPDGTLAHNSEGAMPILRSIVFELNQRLCRMQTLVEEMWYVEEKDLLALALNGSMSFHKFNLTCLHPDWTGTV